LGIAAIANRMEAMGVVLMVLGIAQLIVLSLMFVKGRGPICTEIGRDTISLKLPSAGAAERIERHLFGKTAQA